MRRGVNAIWVTAALATTGCVTDSGKLTIKPVADPFIKATRAGSPALAEARGLLAVGSVGLAIEAFRKALREQPDSVEALAGLAECYDHMGRHDLSQAKYEAALAIAPNDPTLLRTFASSLQRQRRYAEAAALRGEATEEAQRAAVATQAPLAPVAVAQAQRAPAVARLVAEDTPLPSPPERAMAVQVRSAPVLSKTEWKIEGPVIAPPEATASVTVKLPEATPVRQMPVNVAIATPIRPDPVKLTAATPIRPEPVKLATAASVRAAPLPAEEFRPLPELAPARIEMAARPVTPAASLVGAVGAITVKLPEAAPATAMVVEKPMSAPPSLRVVREASVRSGPRLERLSLGEVALLTSPRARWRTEVIREASISTPIRFAPLAQLKQSAGVRLLNAARHEGLAARTRLALNRQGWKNVAIGNSSRIREKSLILYSAETEQAARRLANRFGFWIAREARPGPLTILLGRDWANRDQARG